MPIVTLEILKSDLGTEKERAIEAAAVSTLVAQTLGRDTRHVHVIYQPEARGRVAFGGQLVR